MGRDILDPLLRKATHRKGNNQCHACGYAVRIALRVHHIVPLAYGGKDDSTNLVSLCGNCHAIVHHLAARKEFSAIIGRQVETTISRAALTRLKTLANRIQNAHEALCRSGHLVPDPHSPSDAIASIASANKFKEGKTRLFDTVVRNVISHVPPEMAARCSYRLLGRGRYLSINRMNYLLFRAPAYGDLGGSARYDAYFILPDHIRQFAGIRDMDKRIAFRFAHFPCVNIGMSLEEINTMSKTEWAVFREACRVTDRARVTRSWASNIDICSA